MLLYSLCVFVVAGFSYQCAQTATACVWSLHKTSANKVAVWSVGASVYPQNLLDCISNPKTRQDTFWQAGTFVLSVVRSEWVSG